jgi:hypothetical protein
MWRPGLDLAAFLGSAVVALALVVWGPRLSPSGETGPITFLLLVIGIDVAHVYSTLFRTYLDREELARRPILYAGVPTLCFAALLTVSAALPGRLWTVLAYVALAHFIRQQVGWVAIYRARAAARGAPSTRLERVVDDAATYAGAGYPVLLWHTQLPRRFEWFVAGDFLEIPGGSWVSAARALWIATLALYVLVAVRRAVRHRLLEIGKHLVVATTAVTWYVGIVATDSDFAFTAANVIPHGVPYLVFLYAYAKRRGAERPGLVRAVAARGALAFSAILVTLAFVEELAWDRLVWHTHDELFGFVRSHSVSEGALVWIVPLLMVPQATHYVLDAFLWRRRETSRSQAEAMGFTA